MLMFLAGIFLWWVVEVKNTRRGNQIFGYVKIFRRSCGIYYSRFLSSHFYYYYFVFNAHCSIWYYHKKLF